MTSNDDVVSLSLGRNVVVALRLLLREGNAAIRADMGYSPETVRLCGAVVNALSRQLDEADNDL